MTKRVKVYGIVQGVGFRPTVARHAAAAGVRGSVCNKGPYVEIIAQGGGQSVADFLERIEKKPPRRAVILKIDVKDFSDPQGVPEYSDFRITESAKTRGEIFIPPDIAVCDECRQELFDPSDRRYLHPFINCTCCGPRLTILEALPYDRERTSMKMFPMCRACSQEYHDPGSRRYDAQPVCCNDCGPQVYWLNTVDTESKDENRETGSAAISRARLVIAQGGIVAVKGIGGYHLCCDATNEFAVQRLRRLKNRPAKPFAVMMRDQMTAERECELSQEQKDILTGHQKPILLLPRKNPDSAAETKLCPGIAPGNPAVGVMLPYAPVQLLLFDYDDGIKMPDCLVMTSGNVSGAPICRDDTEASEELGRMCDGILSHDRKIRIRADDSVMDFFDGKPYMIRRSRGYAPLPYMLSAISGSPNILAVGGELKNTFCIGTGNLFYPSSYIGDLADLRSVKALEETVRRYTKLLEADPQVIACDLHPRYNSVMVAQELAGEDIPVVRVQHHFAHIVSCMAENDFADPVIGVAMDGTGFGTDGSIWGGEILLADYHGFERVGSIVPFVQVGGDASSRDGWRIAVSMLWGLMKAETSQALREIQDMVSSLKLCTEQETRVIVMMAEKKLNAVTSTSAGRLFDAVSAILGICRRSTFEGEASMALEFAAESYEKQHGEEESQDLVRSGERRSKESEADFLVMRTDDIVRDLLQARLRGEDTGRLAFVFHRKLANEIIRICMEARNVSRNGPYSRRFLSGDSAAGIATVALSGGCFQNRLLLRMVKHGLEKQNFKVLTHHLVPPNDGGIALGQAVAAAQAAADGRVSIDQNGS